MDRWQSQLTGWGTQSNGHVRGFNGQRIDLRDVQVIAFEKGVIPYLPADRDQS
jgi:hypothetical protein